MSNGGERPAERASLAGRVLRLLGAGDRGRMLARGATGTFGLKIYFTLAGFGVSLLLSHTLGAAGYGAYAYAIGWMQFLVVLALLGLERLVVRRVAAYREHAAWDLLRGLLRWSTRTVILASLGFAVVVLVVGLFFGGGFDPQMRRTLLLALPVLPFLTLMRIRASSMQGLQHVVRGQVPEAMVQPSLFLLIAGAAALLLGSRFTPEAAVLIQVGAAFAGAVLAQILLNRTLPNAIHAHPHAYETRLWAKSVPPLIFISAMQATNTRIDLLMLGAMKGAEPAGIYTVASRGAGLVTFVLFAVNAALAPTIAAMHSKGEMEGLQRLVTKAARLTLLASLPIGIALILFGGIFLRLFGVDFVGGRLPLTLLALGNVGVAFFGPVAPLMVMTGLERHAARWFAAGAALNVVLNLLLIPRWGMVGAGASMALSMVVWNGLLAGSALRNLGVLSSAFGWKRRPGA